jgi:heptosyltransferase-2
VLEGRALADESVEHGMRGLTGPFAAAQAVRRALRAHDATPPEVLLLPNSARSAVTARLLPARRRIGYATDRRRFLLTDPIDPPSRRAPISAVDWYVALVERGLGIAVADRRPRLQPTPRQQEAGERALAGLARPIALLNPGANRADKRWPASSFVAVGRWLRGQGATVVISGGPGEAPLTREIAEVCGGIDLTPRSLGLGGLLGALTQTALMITNDTGPRHLAIALDIPTIALFGPTDPRWAHIPGAYETRLLAEPFLAEESIADRQPALCRIDRIESADVIATAARLLGSKPARCSDRA